MTTQLVERPSLNPRERTVAVAFGIWMIVGLFLDGWAHDNNKPESFFTPWHGVLYSGFAAATLAAVLVAARSRTSDRPWRETLPAGHGLTLAALAVFAVGAGGDLVWHEAFGVEVGVEALLSPTHLLLLVGGVVALSAPFRAAWAGDDHDLGASLRAFAPTVLALALLTGLVGFFLLYLSPFLNDAAGTRFNRVSDVQHDHPSSDVSELQQLLGIASILMTSVLFSVPAHLVLRRWRPPAGSFALLFGVVTLLFVGLDEFSQPSLVLAGVAGGLVIDLLADRSPAWIAVAAGVTLMWLGYFGLYQVAEDGVAWTAPLWTGTAVLAGLVAGGIGLLSASTGRGTSADSPREHGSVPGFSAR